MTFQKYPGVAVDPRDNVFVITRGVHTFMVFDTGWEFVRPLAQPVSFVQIFLSDVITDQRLDN